MAEDEDGISDKKSSQNTNAAPPLQENDQNTIKPDLGIEETKYNSNGDGEPSSTEPHSSASKSTGATRKDENPFSFRHFLKRDLSLPGNSTYEHTGARPKVYANTVQHSPTKLDVHSFPRRDKVRGSDTEAKDRAIDGMTHPPSEKASSSSSAEISFSVGDNSESKHNLYIKNSESPFYHRPNKASEPLGMPSLPDFVQDHILVEQAYLNSSGPISVDLDNLPDFTFNTSGFNAGSSSSSRRNNSAPGNRDYNYDAFGGAPSTSTDYGSSVREIPLDLPVGAESVGPSPLDLPVHLNLDLTESVNPADRRNVSPRNNFPLDLPPNAGAEAMRLPDFLPVHPGRTSPDLEQQDEQLQHIIAELERTRSELFTERSRRSRLEGELESAREDNRLLRNSARQARHAESELRARLAQANQAERDYAGHHSAGASRLEVNLMDSSTRATEAETSVTQLKKQIKKLREELESSRAEVSRLRARQAGAACGLRRAAAGAEAQLRDLLSGLEQLKTLSSSLEPT